MIDRAVTRMPWAIGVCALGLAACHVGLPHHEHMEHSHGPAARFVVEVVKRASVPSPPPAAALAIGPAPKTGARITLAHSSACRTLVASSGQMSECGLWLGALERSLSASGFVVGVHRPPHLAEMTPGAGESHDAPPVPPPSRSDRRGRGAVPPPPPPPSMPSTTGAAPTAPPEPEQRYELRLRDAFAGRAADVSEKTELRVFNADAAGKELAPLDEHGEHAHEHEHRRASLERFALSRTPALDPTTSFVRAHVDAVLVDESGTIVWRYDASLVERIKPDLEEKFFIGERGGVLWPLQPPASSQVSETHDAADRSVALLNRVCDDLASALAKRGAQ